MAEIRLDKLLSDRAAVTRGAARELIKAGRVSVGGIAQRSPEKKTAGDADVWLDGKPLRTENFRYIMMNKPADVISATADSGQKTVIDLIPETYSRKALFPVGRLDKDTTGLLILTDDGDYCHRATHPKQCIPKLYEVCTESAALQEDIEAFVYGLTLGDRTNCLPARLSIDPTDPCHSFVEVFEGKYHQVKRMFASRGKPVKSLRRVAIGMLILDESLGEGEFREMTGEEAARVFGL